MNTPLLVVGGGSGPAHGPATPYVLQYAQQLYRLREWEPVGCMLETARGALSGHDAITAKEVKKLGDWATKWDSLNEKLKEFYSAHVLDYEEAHTALLVVLSGGNVTGATYGRLKELWAEHFSEPPDLDIVP